VTVTAKDASGATIVGPGNYSPAITLTNSDTSGHTSLSATSVTAPGQTITLNYDGSPKVASLTIGATVSGLAPSSITSAALTPAQLATSAAAFSVVTDDSGNSLAFVPGGSGVLLVPLATPSGLTASVAFRPASGAAPQAAPPSPTVLAVSPVPDECTAGQRGFIYCMSFSSNVISVIGYNATDAFNLSAIALKYQLTTDAPSPGVDFSGAVCVICGIAYDSTDSVLILSTAKGYEAYPTTAGSTTPLLTVPAQISENFGYDSVSNQIFSPYYLFSPYATGLDIINLASGASGPTGSRYAISSNPASLSYPDGGAVDTSTHVAFAPEEGSTPIYLLALPAPGSSAFTSNPSPPPGGPAGTYSATVTSANPQGATLIHRCDETYTAADSVEHIAFFGAEFCSSDYIAAGQLPATAGGAPVFSNFVDAQLPNTPQGTFGSPYDPHAAIVVNIPGCADCGILTNRDKSYLAVVDLNKLLALAPAASPNGYDVPSTYDLVGNRVVVYIPTGGTAPTSIYLRQRAQAHVLHRNAPH
jgi:hypothetical protein